MAGCPLDAHRSKGDLDRRRSRLRYRALYRTVSQALRRPGDWDRSFPENDGSGPRKTHSRKCRIPAGIRRGAAAPGRVGRSRVHVSDLPSSDRSICRSEGMQPCVAPRWDACIRNTTRDCEFVYRHFFPLQPLIDSDLPAREDITSVFVAAGFAATAHQIVSQLVASDWPSFVQYSALRGDSFLARLSDEEFDRGMVALRAHTGSIGNDNGVTEEIDWFVFTKRA
jgi:hypothetical protein